MLDDELIVQQVPEIDVLSHVTWIFLNAMYNALSLYKSSSQGNHHSKYDSGIEELLLKVVSFNESEFQRFED